MSATIYKYPIDIVSMQVVRLPAGSKAIHAGLDGSGVPCIWCLVDTEQPPIDRIVYVIGTGHGMPSVPLEHIGSFVQGVLVWHVWLLISALEAE